MYVPFPASIHTYVSHCTGDLGDRLRDIVLGHNEAGRYPEVSATLMKEKTHLKVCQVAERMTKCGTFY